MKYKFTVDSNKVLAQKGDVEFLIGLERNVNPQEVRSALEKITSEIGYAHYIPAANALVCVTNHPAYERVFEAALERLPPQERNPETKYTAQGYLEIVPATVPEILKGLVTAVHLNRLTKR